MNEFSIAEIDDAVREGHLLALEVDLGLKCDGRCDFCDAPHTPEMDAKLSHREIEKVLAEARQMGARRVSLYGDTWATYPHLGDLLEEIRRLGSELEVHVGDQLPSDVVCEMLPELGARVVVSLHGFSNDVHDRIAGRPGSATEVRQLLDLLREHRSDLPLAIDTKICRANAHEIESLWRWARGDGILPYFENALREGGGTADDEGLDPASLEKIFRRLSELDRREFGFSWDPQPPWPGRTDLRHRYACRLSPDGAVRGPGDLSIEMGNVRDRGLAHVLGESEVFEDLRRPSPLKGPCRRCEKMTRCAGSRSSAYTHTGDYLASDPDCWRNEDQQEDIRRLPLAVANILPQKSPMRFIDMLVAVGDRTGECELTVRDDLPMVGNGVLDEAAYLEIIAQAMAALQSFKALDGPDQGLGGFLVGAESLEVREAARVGDVLRIRIRKETRFGQYGIVEGVVERGSDLLAEGRIKIWREIS